jgi:hypothetical protein
VPASVDRRESARAFPGSSFKYTPMRHIRVLFINFVRGLFRAAPPGDYRWNKDEEQSEIIIRDENPIHVNKYGQRPCVNFTPGRIQFYSLGMDDLLSYSFRTDGKKKGVLVPGTMSINVCARSDIEAHDLAWVVAEHIWLLRDLMLREGFFELGRAIDVSPPGPPGTVIPTDQADGWYLSTVSVPWQFARTSKFTPLGRHIVNSIETQLAVGDPRRVESIGWPYSIYGHPVNVREYGPPPFAPDASDARGATPDPAGAQGYELTKVPHPLNPARTVVVRAVYPFRARNRSASIYGRTLPIGGVRVEQS